MAAPSQPNSIKDIVIPHGAWASQSEAHAQWRDLLYARRTDPRSIFGSFPWICHPGQWEGSALFPKARPKESLFRNHDRLLPLFPL